MATEASYTRIHRIIASQAVTGESIGIDHYARMIPLSTSLAEKLALLEDAWRERQHLLAVQSVAEAEGWELEDGRDDPYWSRIRAAFEENAERGDLLGCRVVQDLVLECFAVSLYKLLAPKIDARLSHAFERIAVDEEQHLQQGLEEVRGALLENYADTLARLEFANERVARVLAEWLQPQDCEPVCGVCGKVGGGCAKPALQGLELDLLRLRAVFVNRYGAVLREAGVEPAKVTRFLARLLV